MAAMFGVLQPVLVWVTARAMPLAAGDASLSALLHWPLGVLPLGLGVACFAGVLFLGRWRDHTGAVVGGAVIGLLVVAGWWVTGVIGADDFEPRPPASLTMAAPLARTLTWLTMGQATGTAFAMALVPGVLFGALAGAVASGEFRWVPPAGERVGAYLAGGALMGVGAQLAGGCNIGQGLTGAATLSATSLLAIVGIVGGMSLGMAWLNRSSR